MSLRFRRSVRLAPGVRVNFSKSGMSLSMGGRGGTVNLSSRGTRTTFGIPGTGLSWSQRSSTKRAQPAAHRPTARSIEAARRRAEREERVAVAEAYVERNEAARRSIVEQWRNLTTIPPRRAFEEALEPRPYVSTLDGPGEIDEAREMRVLRQELLAKARSEVRLGKRWALAALPPVAGAVAWMASSTPAGLVLALTTAAVIAVLWLWRTLDAHRLVRSRIGPAWEIRRREVQVAHGEAVARHREREAAAANAWREEDDARISNLRALLRGEREASEVALDSELSLLDFPFEAECRFEIPEARRVHLVVDLPEVEDVIPETGERVLRDGSIKVVDRTRKDRHADYARLATGLALQLASAAFAASPVFEKAIVAAYTQRREPKTGRLRDEWVYEVVLDRKSIETLVPERVDPIDIVTRSPGRIDLRPNFDLRAITPPDWWAPEVEST